jgi:DNA helicase-2/ATP-dependent DNA helicase PcrA
MDAHARSVHAGLNDAQREAVTHVEGPMLVLAGPGSGKTRVVTHRIANLIAGGAPPERIVALTFTNKAADEMRRRLTDLAGPQPVEMGTFHRFAARLLRRHARLVGLTSDYSILDTDDAHAVLKRAAKRVGVPLTHSPVDRLAGIISRAKNNLRTPETFEPRWGQPAEEVAQRVWPAYQRMLLECNAVDFDDLLAHVAAILVEHADLRAALDERYRFVLVDEYQDTNAVQYCIARGLSIDHPNLAVTGDPDQAIYGWRGASIRNILEFERDYPQARVVRLERNYRSTANILAVADRLISHNSRRKPKRLLTDSGPGDKVRIVLDSSSHEEAERIASEIDAAVREGRRSAGDCAVLFRTNALSRSIEVALRTRGVPYQLVRGLEFFKRREVKDVVAWLRLVRNPADDEAFLRVVNVPARGIGRQTLERLGALAADRGATLLETARDAGGLGDLSKRARAALGEFVGIVDGLSRLGGSAAALVQAVLDRTGYRRLLEEESELAEEEGQDRLANVEELVTVAAQVDEELSKAVGGSASDEIDPLGAFLERTALVSDTDDWDASTDRVSLMTLHAAKGLEFPVVYVMALEEGICPHERAIEHPEQLEEERRLVFVGITRGREEVHASCARLRDYRGSRRINPPSAFLTELVGEETVLEGSEAPQRSLGGAAWRPTGDWDDACQVDPRELDDPREVVDLGESSDPHEWDSTGGDADDRTEPPAAAPRRAPSRAPIRLTTADRLADPFAPSPDEGPGFHEGQRVRHPDYGEGTVERIGGLGPKAVGTVRFDTAGRRTFVLARAALVPLP